MIAHHKLGNHDLIAKIGDKKLQSDYLSTRIAMFRCTTIFFVTLSAKNFDKTRRFKIGSNILAKIGWELNPSIMFCPLLLSTVDNFKRFVILFQKYQFLSHFYIPGGLRLVYWYQRSDQTSVNNHWFTGSLVSTIRTRTIIFNSNIYTIQMF